MGRSNKKENERMFHKWEKQNRITRGGRPVKFYFMEDLLPGYFQG